MLTLELISNEPTWPQLCASAESQMRAHVARSNHIAQADMSEQLQIKQANKEMDSCDLTTAWLQRSVTSLQGQKSQQTASRPVLGAVTKKNTLCHNMGLASRGASATFRDMGFGLRGNKACNMLRGSFHELPRRGPCPFLQQNTFRRQEFGAPKLGFLHGLFDRCSSEA